MLVSSMAGRVPVTVIHVGGQIDASNAGALETKVAEVCGGGARDVLLDLGRTTYLASAGYRAIHRIYKMLEPEGAEQPDGPATHFKLFDVPDEIRRVIKTLGFDRQLSVLTGDLRKAVDSF
jgi:anti-anti-sigma factor